MGYIFIITGSSSADCDNTRTSNSVSALPQEMSYWKHTITSSFQSIIHRSTCPAALRLKVTLYFDWDSIAATQPLSMSSDGRIHLDTLKAAVWLPVRLPVICHWQPDCRLNTYT